MSSKRSNVIVQAAILTFAGILVRLIGVLYRSPLTAIIGDEGNGIYGAAYNIYTMILLISSYSIPSAISKVIASHLALREYRNAHRVFQCALVYVIAVGGVASLAAFFLAPALVIPNAVVPLRILSLAIFFSGILGAFRGYFQAYGSMVQTSVSQIIEQIVNAIVSVGAAYLFTKAYVGTASQAKVPVYGAAGSTLGTVAGVVFALLFMLFVYRLNLPYFRKKRRKDAHRRLASYPEIFRSILLTVTPIIFSTFIYNISTSLDMELYFRIAMKVKGWTETQASVHYGIFAGKYTVITNIPIAFASAMSSAIIPSISANFAKRNFRATKEKVAQAIRFTMLIAIPAAVGISVLAYPIVSLLFPQPESVEMASSLIRFGGASIVLYSLSTLTNAVLQGIGRVNVPVRNSSIALVVHVAALAPLLALTDWDLYALVLGAILYSLTVCVLNAFSVARCLAYRQEIVRTFLIPLLSSLLMGAVTWLSYRGCLALTGISALGLLVSVALSCLVYFVAMIKLKGISEEDLLAMPKGGALLRLARKMRLL